MRNQRGFISLLTVSIMSLLIVVLTVAMAQLMNGELHQSTDSADSIKAYYTAQGAAEDVAQKLRSQLAAGVTSLSSLNQGCNNQNVYGSTISTDFSSAISAGQDIDCVQVATDFSQINSSIDVNNTKSFDLSSTDSVLTDNGYIHRVDISWDDNGVTKNPGAFNQLLKAGSWNPGSATQPPAMEVGIINFYPNQQSNVQQNNGNPGSYNEVVLTPCQAGQPGCPSTSSPQVINVQALSSPLVQVECGSVANRCSVEFTNLVATPEYRTVVTLTPLFHDTQFSMSAYAVNPRTIPPGTSVGAFCQQDSTTAAHNDCVATIAPQDATINVNSTVGQTNREVELNVPLRAEPPMLNQVLEGDNDVCKSFDVLSIPGYSEIAQLKPVSCSLN